MDGALTAQGAASLQEPITSQLLPDFCQLPSHCSGIARWWWKAQPFDLCHGDPMAIGIVFSVFGLSFFRWLFSTLAVYALPFLGGLKAPILRRELDAQCRSQRAEAECAQVLVEVTHPRRQGKRLNARCFGAFGQCRQRRVTRGIG